MNNVYVVTNPELGWNSVIGVFDADKVCFANLREFFPASDYVIQQHDVEQTSYDPNC